MDIVIFTNSGNRSIVIFENTSTISTSTIEERFPSLKVYPSFSSNFFQIETVGNFDFVVSDSQGKRITTGEGFQKTILHCDDWQSGTYFITVLQEESMQTQKVLKIR